MKSETLSVNQLREFVKRLLIILTKADREFKGI